MSLKLKYKMTEEDYISFNKYVIKKQNIIATIIVAISFAIILISAEQSLIYAIPFILIYILLCEIDIKIRCRKIYRNSKNMQEEAEITIDEKEIIEKSESSTSVFKTENLNKCCQNKKYYYLFKSKVEAYVIPKKILSEEEKQKLEEIIKPYIKK